MDIPQDILDCIGQYLPERALRRCMHVSSVFLHLHLKARYKTMLVKWGTEAGMRRVMSIRDSPLVRGYIHHLELWMVDNYVFTFETFAGELLAAIKEMPNLTAVNLSIKRIPPIEDMVEPTTRFFDSFWRVTGPALTHLTLSGFKPYIEEYIPSPAVLPNLQKLTLGGRKWVSSPNGVGTDVPLLLNRLAPQLKTLEINDSFALIAPHLPKFTSLEELSLTLRFEGTGTDLATQFLRTQTTTTLRTPLQFHLTLESISAYIQIWSFLSELSSSPHKIHLRTLKIKYTPYEVCARAIRALSIPRYFDTLHTLEISGRAAGPSTYEIRELVSAISMFRELGTLSLDVPRVSLELLVLLSKEMARIKSLRLDTAEYELDFNLEPEEETSLRAWKLIDLSVYYGWEVLDYESMMKIARVVPSIESFWGKGDMDPPVVDSKTKLEGKIGTMWDSSAVKYLRNHVREWLSLRS